MDLRGRLTRIVVKEDEIWVTVLYPKSWIGETRYIKFPVSSVAIGLPLIQVYFPEDPEFETSASELADSVADAIYDDVVETLKVAFSDQGVARVKDIDVSVNSHYELKSGRGGVSRVFGLVEVDGALHVVFDPPIPPEDFKGWITEKLRFLNEEFPYIVEDLVSGSIMGFIFATLETEVKIPRKAGFGVLRTEFPSGKLRDLSPFFTISFKITAPERILDGLKEALSKVKNEKEALKTLSFYLSMFSDSVTTTTVYATDEDEYDNLSFAIYEETGRRTSIGQPEGVAVLLTKILDLLG